MAGQAQPTAQPATGSGLFNFAALMVMLLCAVLIGYAVYLLRVGGVSNPAYAPSIPPTVACERAQPLIVAELGLESAGQIQSCTGKSQGLYRWVVEGTAKSGETETPYSFVVYRAIGGDRWSLVAPQ